MTLNTPIVICEPVDPKEAFRFGLDLLLQGVTFLPRYRAWKAGDSYPSGLGRYDTAGFCTVRDQGLAAILHVSYATDAPLLWGEFDDEPEPWFNKHLVSVDFDTGYLYRAPNGAGCADLHAWLVDQYAGWLAEQGVTKWAWYDETADAWHLPGDGYRLGDPVLGALRKPKD